MATIHGYTAEHMQEIEAATIVSGAINPAGHLILTRHDGSTMDAGLTISTDNFASVTETFSGLEPLKAISPLSIAQLTAGTALSSTQDLDLMVQNGQFHQGTQGNATLALHYPNASQGGMLIVQSQASFVSQIFVPRPGYTGFTAWAYQRAKFSTNAWSDWQPLATETGYRLLTTVYFTSSGTFTKASYPGLKAVRTKVQGGGGAGGGAGVASGGNHSQGGGGGGGGYAEDFAIATALATSISVTVGGGGTGSAGGAGGTGGTSSFGSLCVATGGTGGGVVTNAALGQGALGGDGGQGTAGDLWSVGGGGGTGTGYATLGVGGSGGASVLGGGGAGVYSGATASQIPGNPGGNRGGGGGGAQTNQNSTVAQAGGNGGAGLVIVEVYV